MSTEKKATVRKDTDGDITIAWGDANPKAVKVEKAAIGAVASSLWNEFVGADSAVETEKTDNAAAGKASE